MILKRQTRYGDAGFSLIELMAVVIIVGILSGLAIPSFQRNWQQERLKAATREATTWLEDVQLRAVQQSQTCVIQVIDSTATLQPSTNTNPCINISTLNLRNSVQNAQQLVLCSQAALTPSNVECNSNSSQTTPTEITITPRGTVSQGGLIKLHFSETIPNRCIAITQPLGMVRQGIERSTGCDYNTAF